MSKHIHYVLQLAPDRFKGYVGQTSHIGEAMLINTLTDARRLFKLACREVSADTPSRFPRVIKTTIETKTIITRR